MERYVRGNGKWAKITRRKRGSYYVAFGFEGDVNGIPYKSKIVPFLSMANVYARGWVNDN